MGNLLKHFKKEMRPAKWIHRIDGSYSGPDWIPGTPTTEDIKIVVPQPVKENELDPLPEGEGVSDFRKTWTETYIQTRRGDKDADVIEYPVGGRQYKVFQVDDRDVLGGYYRVIMREIV